MKEDTVKSIMAAIGSRECEELANGRQHIILEKTKPKINAPFKVYIYCTNKKPYLVWGDVFRGNWYTEFTHISGYSRKDAEKIWEVFNGNVIGETICDKCIKLFRIGNSSNWIWDHNNNEDINYYIDKALIREKDALNNHILPCTELYAWSIKKLKIYDSPEPISSFTDKSGLMLKYPPQSWIYITDAKI